MLEITPQTALMAVPTPGMTLAILPKLAMVLAALASPSSLLELLVVKRSQAWRASMVALVDVTGWVDIKNSLCVAFAFAFAVAFAFAFAFSFSFSRTI
jgi:hypothetical protein